MMEKKSGSPSAGSLLVSLQIVLLSVVVLYFGRGLFVPLSFSFLIGFVLFPVCKKLESKGFSRISAIALPLAVLFLLFLVLGYFFVVHLLEISNTMIGLKPAIMAALHDLSRFLADKAGLSTGNQVRIFENFINNLGTGIPNLFRQTFSSLSQSLFYLIMVPVFSFLILLYRAKLIRALFHFFPNVGHGLYMDIIRDVMHHYYSFIKGMAMVYFLVGILNSVGLMIIGVPRAVFFGFLVSVFTFIPYVGIMLASILPVSAAWLSFDSLWYPFAVVAWFAFVQVLEAYLIFPLVIGKRIKVNALVLFVFIILGGMLWGAAGMILFIPVISIVKLLSSRSPDLKFISDLLDE